MAAKGQRLMMGAGLAFGIVLGAVCAAPLAASPIELAPGVLQVADAFGIDSARFDAALPNLKLAAALLLGLVMIGRNQRRRRSNQIVAA
jgi:hypothetical protein